MARKIQINFNKQPNTKESTASWVGHTIVIGYFKNVTLFTGSLESDTINNNDSDPKKVKPKETKGVSSNKETDTTNQRIISSTGKKFGDAFRTLPIDNNGNVSIDLPDLVFGASESSEDEPNVNFFAVTISVIAPNGSLLLRQDFNTQNNAILNISNSSFISSNSVVMPVSPVNQVDLSNIPSTPAAILRIKGKAVDLQGQRAIKNEQVILWETFPDDATKPAKVIQIAFTDNQGNFSCEVPNRAFENVEAIVALAPTQRIPVSLKVSEKVEENGRIEDFIYLVLSNLPSLSGEEDDCSCHDVTPYLPNAEELVSDQYAQDIGGSCTNFTKPNRVLEEFDYYSVVRTTDPKIKAMTNTVENATVNSLLDGIKNPYINAESAKADPNLDMYIPPAQFSGSTLLTGRQEISEQNSIDWDATPTSYQATTIAHGHLLHFKQRFKAAGYSLGDLLYSLPLAPGQKKQIVMYDWDRKDSAARSEELSAEDRLTASLSRDRDISDIASGVVNEKIRGGSDVEEKSKGWDVGASVSVPLPGAVIGVEGGYSSTTTNTNSTAWQDSSRSTVMNSMQSLRDKTQQSASSVRNQRTSVIQSFDQSEHYGVTSEVIANHNHCHAVTMQYFEVLRHFAIEQDLTDVQECLFIPLQLGFFDKYKILRWKNILRNNLRISKTGYYRHPLYKAFDVLEKYVANPNYKPEHPIADQQITEIKGEVSISFRFSIPPMIPQEQTQTDNTTGSTVTKTIYVIDEDAWHPYIELLSNSGYGLDYIRNQFSKFNESSQINVFYRTLVPIMVDKYLDMLKISLNINSVNETLLQVTKTVRKATNNYNRAGSLSKGGKLIGSDGYHVTVAFHSIIGNGLKRRDIENLNFKVLSGTGKNNQDYYFVLPDLSDVSIGKCLTKYETSKFQGRLLEITNIQQNLNGDDVTFFTPCNAIELRDPAKEEWDACVLLVTHLNEFIEYYHKVLWLNMDPDKRFMLLDGYNVTYETEIKSDGTRVEHKKSLASVLENRLIGIVGNCLVMPVSRGYQLDPTFKAQPGQIVNLLDHYKPTTPIPPFRISVPTKGVFAEAVMGACNSCEKIDDTRFWKWEEHPIPDPTAINPITAPTPQYQSQDMTAKDFAQPIVNIQNAPQAPEYKGLDAVQGVVNAPFKDITGLEGNQRNANDAFRQTGERIGNAMDGAERAMIAGGQYALARNQQILDALAALNGLPIPPEQKEKIYNDLMNNFRNNKASDLGREQQTSDVDAISQLNKDGKISDEQAAKYTGRKLDSIYPKSWEETLAQLDSMKQEAANHGSVGLSYQGIKNFADESSLEIKTNSGKSLSDDFEIIENNITFDCNPSGSINSNPGYSVSIDNSVITLNFIINIINNTGNITDQQIQDRIHQDLVRVYRGLVCNDNGVQKTVELNDIYFNQNNSPFLQSISPININSVRIPQGEIVVIVGTTGISNVQGNSNQILNLNWNNVINISNTIPHEFGHIMGLIDRYHFVQRLNLRSGNNTITDDSRRILDIGQQPFIQCNKYLPDCYDNQYRTNDNLMSTNSDSLSDMQIGIIIMPSEIEVHPKGYNTVTFFLMNRTDGNPNPSLISALLNINNAFYIETVKIDNHTEWRVVCRVRTNETSDIIKEDITKLTSKHIMAWGRTNSTLSGIELGKQEISDSERIGVLDFHEIANVNPVRVDIPYK